MIFLKRISYGRVLYYLLAGILFGCNHAENTVQNEYHYTIPDYNRVRIIFSTDSLQFSLGENMYNDIKSFNYFVEDQSEYISFYDRRAGYVYAYQLPNQVLYKKINIKSFYKNSDLYKTSVYIKSWDSVFVINKTHIALYDSAGYRKKRIEFLNDPHYAWAMFDSDKLPVVKGKKVYAIVRPNVKYQSLDALRDWKVLYEFDLQKGRAQLHYHLPVLYQRHLYGYNFLGYNFCYNDSNRFVFSFPADTVVYETNLKNYNHSYFVRSKYQNNPISPLSKEALEKREETREYALRDSYGSIFYDPFRKYYLRLARHKVTEKEFIAKHPKKSTVLILNEDFKIIGESPWPDEMDFDSLFFTNDGKMYTRTNFKDENALHFVRFSYDDNSVLQLTQK